MRARTLCAVLGLWLVLPVAVARGVSAGEAEERRLDPQLKLLYRAQQAERALPAASAIGQAGARTREPLRSERALAVLQRLRGGRPRVPRAASPEGAPTKGESGEPRLRLLVRSRGAPAALESAGFRVQARIGQVYTGSLAVSRLLDLAELADVVFVQASHELRAQARPFASAPLSPSPVAAGPPASSSRLRSVPADAAGTGAIVGYVDTGVDIFHEEFRTSGGQTRIKYLLDFSVPGDVDGDGTLDGPGCPDGSGVDPCFGGTLYDESEINLALSSGSFASKDVTGHGTHGLSIAAGDDTVSPGMAPSADLIVAKATRRDGTLGFESVDIINALSFVDARAEELGRPYVVNLSLGTLFSSHDGRSLEEQAIDALVGPGIAGKAVVVAAGNSSENRSSRFKHLSGTAYVGLESGHTLHIPAYSATSGNGNDRVLLDVWYEGRDKHTVIVRPPAERTDCGPVEVPYGDYADVQTACGDVFVANMGGASPQNGDTEALVLIDDWTGTAPASGDWTVALRGEEVGADGSYDGWVSDDSVLGAETPYLTTGADNRLLVGKPGSAYNAITVGSFAKHEAAASSRFKTSWADVNGEARVDDTALEGDISAFSSPGGTRDGRVKPEVASPGERVLGAVSGAAYPPGVAPPPGFETSASSIYQYRPTSWSADALISDRTANHGFGLLQGTSFASPVVSGVVARILSTNPGLDAVQVRNMLINSALVDGFVTAGGTRAVPNELWGYGKLDTVVGAATPLPSDLRITTDELPAGAIDQPYSVVLTASGGMLPYTWSTVAGSLPPGLILSANGALDGTPTLGGSFSVTLQAGDAGGQAAQRSYALGIDETAPLAITTDDLPSAHVGTAYTLQLEAEGGAPPYTWSLLAGSLPAGLTLDSGGRLAGVPTQVERVSFTVGVTDAASRAARHSLRMRVAAASDEAWHPLGNSAVGQGLVVKQVAVDPADSNHVFAAVGIGHSGMFETSDSGRSWKALPEGAGLGSLRLNPVTRDLWTLRAPFWLGDQLQTPVPFRWDAERRQWLPWTYCPGYDDPTNPVHGADVASGTIVDDLAFDSTGAVYALTFRVKCPSNRAVESSSAQLLRSTDQGGTWHAIGTLPGTPARATQGDLGRHGSLAFDASASTRLFASRVDVLSGGGPYDPPLTGETTTTVFRSGDSGASWTAPSGPHAGASSWGFGTHISPHPTNGQDLLLSEFAEVKRSLDGGLTWSSVLGGFDTFWTPKLVRSSAEPAVVLASTYFGNVFRSLDAGTSWSTLSFPGGFGQVKALEIDPRDADRMWIGSSLGILQSTDRGGTWKTRNSGLRRSQTYVMAVSPAVPTESIVFAEEGPYQSKDGGAHWTYTDLGYATRYSPSFPRIASDPSRYYVVYLPHFTSNDQEPKGLFRSDDHGLTWRLPNPSFGAGSGFPGAPGSTGQRIVSFDVDPRDPDRLVAALASNADHSPLGTFLSTDGGVTWTLTTSATPGASGRNETVDSAIAFARDVPGRVFMVAQDQVYRSDDGGAAWTPIGGPAAPVLGTIRPAPSDSRYVYVNVVNTTGDFYALDPDVGGWEHRPGGGVNLAVDPQNSKIVYANSLAGIDVSSDGGRTWSSRPLSPPGTGSEEVNGLVHHPTQPGVLWVVTRFDGVFHTTDGGLAWEKQSAFGTVADVVTTALPSPTDPATVFAGTEGFGVQVSTDGGIFFASRASGLGNLYVRSLAFDPVTPTTLYAGTDAGIYKSTDSANTWTPTAQGAGRITDIVVDTDGGSARRIWATVEGQGVACSLDQGATFQVYSTGLASLVLTSLELDHTGTVRRIWGTTKGGDGVVYSDDDGLTWKSAAGNGLTNRNVNDAKVQSGSGRLIWGTGRVIWATTDNGVFYSKDGGQSWTDLSLGLPSGVPVTSASIDANTDEVLVSLYGDETGGVYRGGNVTGVWTAFNAGLEELKVKKLTNDGGRVLNATTKATTFYASTAGQGVFAADLRTGAGASPRITTTAMSVGTLRQPYGQMLTAEEGTTPYRWSLLEGSLPPGLTLDASGLVTGSPSAVGNYSFRVQVADQASRVDNGELVLAVVEGTTVGGLPQLSIGDASQPEGPLGTTTFSFPVRLSAPSAGPVTVSFLTAGGSATSGGDFTASSGTLTFAANETTKAIEIAVRGDVRREGDEVFYVNLSAPVGATVSRAQGVGRILDDDASSLDFYTVPPCRVVDTRQSALGPVPAGGTRRFTLAPACGVPADALAVVVNVTVTEPTTRGNLRFYPAGQPIPLTSTLNYAAAQNRANNAILALGSGGALDVLCSQASGTVHVIIDVSGYYQ
jgi:hypothetical protein